MPVDVREEAEDLVHLTVRGRVTSPARAWVAA